MNIIWWQEYDHNNEEVQYISSKRIIVFVAWFIAFRFRVAFRSAFLIVNVERRNMYRLVILLRHYQAKLISTSTTTTDFFVARLSACEGTEKSLAARYRK